MALRGEPVRIKMRTHAAGRAAEWALPAAVFYLGSSFPVSLLHTPGRALGPMAKRVGGPGHSLIHMTGSARIRNLVLFSFSRRDEPERVRMHIDIGDSCLDRGHVAIHAFAARCASAVMGVFL